MKRCFTREQLGRIRTEEAALAEEAQMGLAAHLSKGCRRCWEALDGLPPADPRAVAHPFARALCRVGNPRSWLAIRSEHLRLVREVRHLELGFGFLLVEELMQWLRGRGPGSAIVRFLWRLVDAMLEQDARAEVVTELVAKYHWAMGRILLRQGELGLTDQALEAAEHCLGTFAPASARADLRLLRLDLARAEGKMRHVLREMHELRKRMPECDALRRFEIAEGIIEDSPLLASVMCGEAVLSRDATFVLSQLAEVSRLSDPLLRLNGLRKKASFAQKIEHCAYMNHGAHVAALAPIAGELEGALSEVESHGDLESLALFHHTIGVLKREAEPAAASRHFLSALLAWARLGDVGHYSVTLAYLEASASPEGESNAIVLADRLARESFGAEGYEQFVAHSRSFLRLREIFLEGETDPTEVVH